MEVQPFPTYMIIVVPINEIQLWSRKTINKEKLVVIIQEEAPQEQTENHIQQEKKTKIRTKWTSLPGKNTC